MAQQSSDPQQQMLEDAEAQIDAIIHQAYGANAWAVCNESQLHLAMTWGHSLHSEIKPQFKILLPKEESLLIYLWLINAPLLKKAWCRLLVSNLSTIWEEARTSLQRILGSSRLSGSKLLAEKDASVLTSNFALSYNNRNENLLLQMHTNTFPICLY